MNGNQGNKQSKSARRKQALIRRGEAIQAQKAQATTRSGSAIQNPPGQGTSRSARRRRARLARGGPSIYQGGRSSNQYLRALMYPEDAQGAKIPDLLTFPTSTFQTTLNVNLTTGNTAGDSVFAAISPIVGDGVTAGKFPITWYNGTASGVTSVATNVNWGNFGTMGSIYQWFRPVSMSAVFMFVGPSTADGGTVVGGCVPRGTVTPTTIGSFNSYPFIETFPLKNGLRVVWKPQDNSDFEFFDTDKPSIDLPQLMIGAQGMPPTTSYVKLRVVANWEAIPKTDTIDLVTAEPSPADIKQLEGALSWVGTQLNNVGPFVQLATAAYTTGAVYAASRYINGRTRQQLRLEP